MVKCPTCANLMFVPMDEFNGNFGEITGKCLKCERKAYIMVIVCDDERRKEAKAEKE